MAAGHGTVDTVGVTQVNELSGGKYSTKLVTTDDELKTPGNFLSVDIHGIVVDTGVSTRSVAAAAVPRTPVLDAVTFSPIMTDQGDWIFPTATATP